MFVCIFSFFNNIHFVQKLILFMFDHNYHLLVHRIMKHIVQ